MVPSNNHELLEELDATQEAYVRKKLALGGFTKSQQRVVEHWLGERAAVRQAAEARSKARATWLRVVIAAAGLAATLVWSLSKST